MGSEGSRSISPKPRNSTVGEVKEAGGLIDEGEAEGYERVDAAGDDSVEKELLEHLFF